MSLVPRPSHSCCLLLPPALSALLFCLAQLPCILLPPLPDRFACNDALGWAGRQSEGTLGWAKASKGISSSHLLTAALDWLLEGGKQAGGKPTAAKCWCEKQAPQPCLQGSRGEPAATLTGEGGSAGTASHLLRAAEGLAAFHTPPPPMPLLLYTLPAPTKSLAGAIMAQDVPFASALGRLNELLLDRTASGDEEGVRACLAAGADPGFEDLFGARPLFEAALAGHPGCVAALLEAGGDPNMATDEMGGMTPLLLAAIAGSADAVAALLAAGADPLAVSSLGRTALHHACTGPLGEQADARDTTDLVQQLLQAAPAAALVKDRDGSTPVELALGQPSERGAAAARVLLQQGALPLLAGPLLALLRGAGDDALPLVPLLVARLALSEEDWAQVPVPCPGLGTALPAVLARSATEAGCLVRHLPAADRERLQTAALCLARVQRRLLPAGQALPAPLAWRVLALAVAA
ncbi:hypothetical protein ABPG75_006573 [Micractinium tetrahymenae]